MAIVDGSLQLGYKNNAWFTANASLVLLVGQIVYLEQTGTYKLGDGVTALSALTFLGGGSGSGVQSVTGANVDNTDPLNPIVNEQTTVNGETIETQNNKGQANGYVELDLANRYLFPAQANPTIKSIIRNINTVARNYIFPDANGTVALTIDIPTTDTTIIDGSTNPVSGNAVFDGLALKSNIASPTFTGTVTTPAIIVSSETSSRVAIIDASKNVKSADTATYPSLTELATVKGVTSSIQTQLNNKFGIIAKDISTSSALTGTTAITLIKSVLIPANTFTTGDICQIVNRAIRSTATGASNNYIYINTANSLSGATLVGTQGGAVRFYGMERNLYIKSATVTETFDTASSASGDNPTALATANSNLNIDWTVDQYIIQAFSNQAVGNSTVSSGLIVTKF